MFVLFCFVFVILLFRATPTAYGGSQASGRVGALATGLHHGHSSARSELRLRPTPQLIAALDPWPAEGGRGSDLRPHGYESVSLAVEPLRELQAPLL